VKQIEFELNKEFRDRFQEALNARDNEFIRTSLEEVNPADITALLYEFNGEESKYVLDLLPVDVRAKIINEVDVRAKIINDLDTETRKSFLTHYTAGEITEVVNHLDSDDAADILNELPIKTSGDYCQP